MDPLEGLSQPDSACFIVYNSQEEESEMISDPIQMLEKLPALRDPEISEKREAKDMKSSQKKLQEEEKYQVKSSTRKIKTKEGLGRQVPGSSNEGSGDDVPGDVPEAPGGNGAPPGGPGGGGGGGNNQGGGAGGGAGGDGGGDGGQQGEAPPGDSDSDEEHAEPLQSSSESGGSIPQLMPVQPSTSSATPPRSLPRHFAGHHQMPSTSRDDSGLGPSAAPPPRLNGDSESEGGLSEASTAVVSDTEGHGQIIQPRSSRGPNQGRTTQSPGRSPGRSPAAGSPRAREAAHDTSSALSTLSSYTSSSSSECPPVETPSRKRGAPKKLAMPPSKKTRVDTSSSSSTSETKKTTSSSDTTRSTSKSLDTSDDTSTGEDKPTDRSQHASGHASQDVSGDVGSSQQDMFAEEPEPSGKQGGPTDDDLPPVLTPADHLESLNFSGQRSTPHTDSHIFGTGSFPLFSPTQSLGYVPASQETFSSSVPYLMPGSPTDTTQEEYGSQRFREALGGVRKVTTKKSSQDIKEDRVRMPPPRLEKATEEVGHPQNVEPRESVGSNNGSDKSRNGSSSSSGSLQPSSLNIPEGQPMESLGYPESSEVSEGTGSKQRPDEDPSETGHSRSQDPPAGEGTKDKTQSQSWALQLTSTEQLSPEDPEIVFPRIRTNRASQSQSRSQQSEGRSQRSQRTEGGEAMSQEKGHTTQPSQEQSQSQSSAKNEGKRQIDSQDSAPSQGKGRSRSSPGQSQEEEAPSCLQLEDTEVGERRNQSSQEEPEVPRMTEGGEEEEEEGEDMVLLLSQTQRSTQYATQYTQHSQSQYSVGVSGILQRLSSTQGNEREEAEPTQQERFPESQTSQRTKLPSQKTSISQDQEDSKRPSRSLTLDMVETQDEENTEMSVPMFQLKRPSLESDADTQESEAVISSSVFRRARQVREKQQEATHVAQSSEDPFAFSSQSYERQKSYDSLQEEKRKEKRPKIPKSSQPTPKKSKWPATESSATESKPSSTRRKLEPETPKEDSEDDVIFISCGPKEKSESAVRPYSTLDGDETQEYDFTTIKDTEDAVETVADEDTLPDLEETAMDVDPERACTSPVGGQSPPTAGSQKPAKMSKRENVPSAEGEPSQKLPNKKDSSQESERPVSSQVSVISKRPVSSQGSVSSQRSVSSQKFVNPQTSVNSEQSKVLTKAPESLEKPIDNPILSSIDSGESEIIPPTDQVTFSKSKREATPSAKHRTKTDTYTKDSSKKHKKTLAGTPSEKKAPLPSDLGAADTLTLRPQDTFRRRHDHPPHSAPPAPPNWSASGEESRGREEADTQILAGDGMAPHKPVDGGEEEGRPAEGAPVAPRSTAAGGGSQPSRGSEQREPVPSTSGGRDNTGPGEGNLSSSQAGTVLQYTTITTVVHHTVQIVETKVNGRIVTVNYTNPVTKTVDVIREVHEEAVGDVSPSRTVQSLTSGDLADVSSLSKSTGTKTGSSFTSPHNLTSSSPATTLGSGSGSSSHPRPRVVTADAEVQTTFSDYARWKSWESLPELSSDAEPQTERPPGLRRGSSSSSSYLKVGDLTSQQQGEETAAKRKSTNTTTSTAHSVSSLQQSSSLFSTSPEAPHPSTAAASSQLDKEPVFQRPDPPVSTPRAKPAGGEAARRPASPEAQELEYEQKVDSQGPATPKGVMNWGDRTYTARRGRGRGKGRNRGKGRTLVPKSQPTQEPAVEAPEIPDIRPVSPPPASSDRGPPKLERAVPSHELTEGSAVFALWTDDHFYHGRLGELVAPGKFRVKFDDGNAAAVKEADLFASSRLAEGEQILAQHRISSCFDNATVVSIDAKGEDAVYEVEFSNKSRKKVPVIKVCLTREQGMAIKNKPERKSVHLDVEGAPPAAQPASGEKSPVSPATAEPSTTHSSRASRPIQQRQLHPREKAVYAMFMDRFYYPGYLVNEETDGRFTIAYEDGDTHRVRDIYIIHCDLLPVGQSVFAERIGEEGSVPGVIVEVFDEPQEEWGYRVEFPDGAKERLLRRQVILTHEQALALKASTPTLSSTPKISDVTLDNLVAGKRRRHVPTPASPIVRDGSTPGRPSPATAPRPTRKILASGPGSRKGKKRVLSDLGSSAQSSPTPKRRLNVGESEGSGDGGFEPIPFESPVHVRKSQRRTKQDVANEAKGPIPPKGSKLFDNVCFLLTHVDRTPLQRAQERQLAEAAALTSDYSSVNTVTDATSQVDEEDVVETPFDKDHLIDQITAGGGHVLENYIADQLKLYSKCFLISDGHQRTLKYFYCLAGNVPCVSHVWIRDSCRAGKLQDYKNYILPAGIGIESNKVIEARLNPVRPLDKMTIIVSTKNHRFQKMWSDILETAGCEVHSALPDELFTVEVMVTDRNVDEAVLVEVLQADIAVVSSEWAIQCLITGRRLPFHNHPRYRHDFEEP